LFVNLTNLHPIGGISEVQTTSTDYVFDLSQLSNPGELEVGLLGFNTVSSSGFQSLEFIIERGGSPIAGQDYTFTDLATAETFFTDHLLDLGSITDGVGANNQLDLNFVMNLTTLNLGDSFAADMIVANVAVPEPATIGMMAMVAMLLCRARRRC
jgi:hypothetical protein